MQWTTLPCPSTEIKPSLQSPTMNNSLEPLDTAYVANVVRKILAQHNIGQRIFARYVLSLSQGTVSELLSKPKAWAKLTEKGKESYRKMWTWVNSEENILALKSISPRKGILSHAFLIRVYSHFSSSSLIQVQKTTLTQLYNKRYPKLYPKHRNHLEHRHHLHLQHLFLEQIHPWNKNHSFLRYSFLTLFLHY